jgi:signal transduction histidine kinase
VALAIGATVIAVYAISVALAGDIHMGIEAGDTGTAIQSVQPDSVAWDAGFREGQVITWGRGGDEPGGMAVQTAEANGGQPVLFGPLELVLRASVLVALVALVLGVLALPAAGQSARRAELLAVVGILLATIPVAVGYQRTLGLAVIGAAAVAPWVWFARWGPLDRRAALAALGVGAALWLAWLALRLVDPVAAVTPRNVLGVWVGASGILLLVLGARMTPRRVAATVASVSVVDVLVIAATVVLAVVLVSLGVNVLAVGAVLVLVLTVFVVTRRRVAASVDKLLLAELRERTALQATEDERARVAREIHDDPLQQISGVIRELERPDPDPAAATASLRDVAARLRGVATDLHPPALDDLGLVPAIDGLARQVAQPPVEVRIDNLTGFGRAQRPPADVELAAFRIVQEAVANAARHAQASGITIGGDVAPDAIDLVIADDGIGIDPGAVEAAQRSGHMGVGSMRARAAAVGAQLEVGPGPEGGTIVSLRWRR